MSYSCINKQIEQVLKDSYTEGEIVKAVFHIVKQDIFKDMLTSKAEMLATVTSNQTNSDINYGAHLV